MVCAQGKSSQYALEIMLLGSKMLLEKIKIFTSTRHKSLILTDLQGEN
jgi:hypothetical protein